MTYPSAISGRCSNCGDISLTLARDLTEYTAYVLNGGMWEKESTTTIPIDAHESVRFFCANCGTQHVVPKELT